MIVFSDLVNIYIAWHDTPHGCPSLYLQRGGQSMETRMLLNKFTMPLNSTTPAALLPFILDFPPLHHRFEIFLYLPHVSVFLIRHKPPEGTSATTCISLLASELLRPSWAHFYRCPSWPATADSPSETSLVLSQILQGADGRGYTHMEVEASDYGGAHGFTVLKACHLTFFSACFARKQHYSLLLLLPILHIYYNGFTNLEFRLVR